MKYLVATAALAGLLTSAAHAQQHPCKAQVAEEDARAACKKSARKAPRVKPDGGLTPAAEESLNRGMARNVLQSIEDKLRLQRIGN